MSPNPTDRCPHKKRKFGHRQAQREDQVKTQEEDDHLQAEEPPEETTPADTLMLDF